MRLLTLQPSVTIYSLPVLDWNNQILTVLLKLSRERARQISKNREFQNLRTVSENAQSQIMEWDLEVVDAV